MTSFYLLLKTIHILAATLFFGTGLGSAFFKFRADQSGNIEDIVFAQKNIVLADWLFTIPSGILLPLTGLWMVWYLGIPLTTPWIMAGLGLYALAGLCWVPAAMMQIWMREAALHAQATQTPLPPRYHTWALWWLLLGFPAFGASVWTIYIMVSKRFPW